VSGLTVIAATVDGHSVFGAVSGTRLVDAPRQLANLHCPGCQPRWSTLKIRGGVASALRHQVHCREAGQHVAATV